MNGNKPGWFKSTFSQDNQGCVEVRFIREMVLVRDSKVPFGPVLIFDRTEWEAFLLGVGKGQFTIPK